MMLTALFLSPAVTLIILGDLNRYQDFNGSTYSVRSINGARPEIAAPDFSTGDAAGIRAAIGHLAQLGHSNIALLTGRSHVVPQPGS